MLLGMPYGKVNGDLGHNHQLTPVVSASGYEIGCSALLVA